MKFALIKNNVVANIVQADAANSIAGLVPLVDSKGKIATIGDAWDGSIFTTPTLGIPQQNRSILEKIAAIESQQTLRAMREHILGIDTTRLPNIQSQIVALRSQLQ